MSKSNSFENSLLALIFHGDAIADLAENDSSSPATVLYLSLHTADPGEAGNQSTNEASYTAYARQSVARSSSGWTITDNSVSPAANVDFPKCLGGSETITHVGVGTASSGAGVLLYKGALSTSIAVSVDIQPRVEAASTITED